MAQVIKDLAALQRAAADSETRHPRIPMPGIRWRTRIVLPGVLTLAVVGLFGYAAGDALRTVAAVRVVPVIARTDISQAAAGAVLVQAPGWVEADPYSTAVTALADGVVREVLVLEGETVEPGQVVARMVDEDARLALDRAEAVLRERQAESDYALAAHAEALLNWEHPIELTRRVKTAAAQVAEKRAELERWPAELQREEAHATSLRAEDERVTPLYQQGQASFIEYVRAKQAHEAQKAAVATTRGMKPILEAQLASLEAEAAAAEEEMRLRIRDTRLLEETQARVAQARAAVAIAQAQRDEAALRLERMGIKAPVGGVVMNRLAEPGSKLMLNADNPRSAQVVRLYDPSRLQVRIDIPLADAAKVGVGQPAEIVVEVLPDRVFRGQLTRVVNEADVQKNTLQVKVAIENPTRELKPEMLARARFLARASATAGDERIERFFIPRQAVRETAGGTWLWLADQTENVARRAPVQVGAARLDDAVEVTSGLRPGDRVIVESTRELSDGMRIRIEEATQGH